MTHPTRGLAAAVLAAAVTLACQDAPLDPSGDTGQLALLVTFQTAGAAASRAASAGDPAPRIKGRLPGGGERTEDGPRLSRGTGRVAPTALPSARVDAEAAAAGMPGLDAVRVRLTGAGVDSTFNLAQTQAGFEATVTELPVGTYTVTVVGSETALVTWLGTTSGVRVTAGQTATATVNLVSFVPALTAFETPTTDMTVVADFMPVPGATTYAIEIDTDPDFADPTVIRTANTAEPLFAPDVGTFYVRVRAGNGAIDPSTAYPSDPQMVEIVADTFAGDAATNPTALGYGGAANGAYAGLNITPGEEDWFAVELLRGQALTVSVLAFVLGLPSDLDPALTILNEALAVIAENDDVSEEDTDSQVAFVTAPTDGRYLVKVTGFEGVSVGHYELVVSVTNPAQATAGSAHSCAIAQSRDAYCWGRNVSGALGNGSTVASSEAVLVVGGNAFETIAAGAEHSCAVTEFLQVYCWGAGRSGQLGDGAFTDAAVPVFADGPDFTHVTTGGAHSCALAREGDVYCWGANGRGQVGDGFGAAPVGRPTRAATDVLFQTVSAGTVHTCAVSVDGEVYCWGSNGNQQLGIGSAEADKTRPTLVSEGAAAGATYWHVTAGSAHTCALTTDFEAHCWGSGAEGALGTGSSGDSDVPVAVSGGLRFISLDADLGITCGTTAGDEAYCWGRNSDGQLGDGTTESRNTPALVTAATGFLSVDAGGAHGCGRGTDGALYCWGLATFGQLGNGAGFTNTPTNISVAATLTEMTSGALHTCALNSAGGAFCWGDGESGQLGNAVFADAAAPVAVTGGLSFTTVSAGRFHTCGISSLDAAAYCWGANGFGQLGASGTQSENAPVAVFGGNQFDALGAGGYHACAIDDVADAYCWGDNRSGQLGNNTTSPSSIPVLVGGGLKFGLVAGGGSHSCGATTGGVTYCWGKGDDGQLGNGAFLGSSAPTAVSGASTYTVLTAGDAHTCGLTALGRAYCWGANDYGQLGDGTLVPKGAPTAVLGDLTFKEIDAEGSTTCAVTTAGDSYCWGWNLFGGLGDGTFTDSPDPVAVSGGPSGSDLAVGGFHACGIDAAGALCWGDNREGQIGIGTTSRVTAPTAVTGGIIFRASRGR